MDKTIQQMIANGVEPRELCEQGVCVSFAEGRRMIQNERESLRRWIQTAMDLNPDKGTINAAKEWCEMRDLEWNDHLESVAFLLTFNLD